METKFSSGKEFLRKGRLTVVTDAMLFAMTTVYACPGRIGGTFGTNHGRHIASASWDVEELIANIDLPFGAPSPKIRTALLASRDRVGTRGLSDLMWCWARLRETAAAGGVEILDWFIINDDDDFDFMSRIAGLDPWGLWDDEDEHEGELPPSA